MSLPNQTELLESLVDCVSTKIIKFPERIWVFGGTLSDIKAPEAASFRDKFVRHVHDVQASFVQKMAKPEDFPSWWNSGGYPDLLQFESDAGCLSQLIVIFLESPGAWVEFGAFANDPDLSKRLLIVVPEKFRNGESFIELGPLRRIANLHPDDDGICVVQSDRHQDLDNTELQAIVRSIEARLRRSHKSEIWAPDKRAHRLLLAADLADLYQVIRTRTIVEIASIFGFSTSLSEVNMQGRLLHMLGLAKFKELGTEKFLCTAGRNAHILLNYQGLPGHRFDRNSFKLDAAAISQKDELLQKALGVIVP